MQPALQILHQIEDRRTRGIADMDVGRPPARAAPVGERLRADTELAGDTLARKRHRLNSGDWLVLDFVPHNGPPFFHNGGPTRDTGMGTLTIACRRPMSYDLYTQMPFYGIPFSGVGGRLYALMGAHSSWEAYRSWLMRVPIRIHFPGSVIAFGLASYNAHVALQAPVYIFTTPLFT